MPSRLLLDITRLLWRMGHGRLPTGIDRVCQAYVERYGGQSLAVVQTTGVRRVLSAEASRKIFRLVLSDGDGFWRKSRQIIASDWLKSPRGVRPEKHDLYLNVGHTGLNDSGHASWLSRSGVRPVYFVHDLIPITHPQYCRSGEQDKHVKRMATVLSHAAGVITNSQDTLDALERFSRDAQRTMPPAQVALLAPAGLPPAQALRPLPQPYFVVLGTIEPRKNHGTLLQVWQTLIREMGERAPHLVIIGQRGWDCENVVDLLERSELLRGFVHEKPGCSDAELSTWLRHAQALLFPSFVEGYGMPLAEALAAGTPVVASQLDVFHEIAGTVPDYVDPLDGPGWSRAVCDYAQPGSERRAAQLMRLQGFVAPTWEQHFTQVDALLERLG